MDRTLYNLVFFLILVFVACANAKRFRCDYDYDNKTNLWLKLHKIPAQWWDAKLMCYLEGGTLASPTDELREGMLKFIDSEGVTSSLFTGINALYSKMIYTTIEGIPLSNISYEWAVGEPNNWNGEEHCITMTPNGEFADVKCDSFFPYICYQREVNDSKTDNADLVCEGNGYVYSQETGSCYKYHKHPLNWTAAYMTCAAEGGHLAIINSEAERVFLGNLKKDKVVKTLGVNWEQTYYIGYTYCNQTGLWTTIHGQSLEEAGFATFDRGEPNNVFPGEQCGSMMYTGVLNDVYCWPNQAFICERKPHWKCNYQ